MEQAKRLLQRIAAFDSHRANPILVVADAYLSEQQWQPILDLGGQIFKSGEVIQCPMPLPDESFPCGHNFRFEVAAQHIAKNYEGSWLWLDPYCVPIRKGWLGEIEHEHAASQMPFLAQFLEPATHGTPYVCTSAVGVYPAQLPKRVMQTLISKRQENREITCAQFIVPFCARSKTILSLPFIGKHRVFNQEALAGIPRTASIVHTGDARSLIAALNGEPQTETPVEAPQVHAAPKVGGVYYHSGSLGDVIYGLYGMKKAGGGKLILGPKHRKTTVASHPITEEFYDLLAPLLSAQKFITSHEFSERHPGTDNAFDLNTYRTCWEDPKVRERTGINLLAHMYFFILNRMEEFRHDEPWLTSPRKIQTGLFTVHRSPRYHNELFPWKTIYEHFKGRLLFVGLPSEHKEFTRTVGKVSYWNPQDFGELASVIAGSEGFIGNQSFPCSLAIGLGKRVIQEVTPVSPDCLFRRKNFIGYESGKGFDSGDLKKWETSELYNGEVPAKAAVKSPPAISVLVFNKIDLTRRCLAFLYRNTPEFNLWVTNNASSDGTTKFLDEFAKGRPNCHVVHNKLNLGFQEPNQKLFQDLCASENPPEFFVLLNNDVEVGPGWWQSIERIFDSDPRIAIVGSSRGTCGKLTFDFQGGPLMRGEQPEYVEGSLMAIRTSVVKRLGLFDPHLQFMYGEDSDLCLRVREAGYKIAVADINCAHVSSQTLRSVTPELKARIDKHHKHNHEYLKRKWRVYLKRRNFQYTVLLKREAALGDVIDVTAVLPFLTKRWPECSIAVQTKFPEVFLGMPVRAEYSVLGNYDYVYDLNLSYEKQPDWHTMQAYFDSCEIESDWKTAVPQLSRMDENDEYAARLLSGKQMPVAVHACPSWPGKTWPEEKWKELLKELNCLGVDPVLLGADRTLDIGSLGLDLRGKTSLPQSMSVIAKCKIFVGIDSGPSHIAQAVGCPAVVLFGTVLAERKLFPACRTIGIQATRKQADCVGLHHRLKPPVTSSDCDGACMRAISMESVREAVLSFVK